MYNWEECAGQGLLPCPRHRMQCEECLCILWMSLLVRSLPPVPTLLLPKPQWSKAQGVSLQEALVQSHTAWWELLPEQSFLSFSALGTLLLDNRVANVHSQWDFPFQAWRWKMLKKLCSYAVSVFTTTFSVVLWPFISTRSILGEIKDVVLKYSDMIFITWWWAAWAVLPQTVQTISTCTSWLFYVLCYKALENAPVLRHWKFHSPF